MSCEIRSMMTSYFFGSSIRMPPIFTNSAVTPSAFMELIFSTNAGGNVFSIPKRIPIFLSAINLSPRQTKISTHVGTDAFVRPPGEARPVLTISDQRPTTNDQSLKILSRHPLPQRPIMPAVIPVDIQPMRNSLTLQNPCHLHVRIQAYIPIGRSQHNLHLPVPVQEPLIARVWQVIRRIIEIDIVIVIAVEEALDVKGSAHGYARRNHIRMPQGKIQRMITAETAPCHRDLRRPVFPLQIRQKLVDHIALVLHVPPNPRSRMSALVVPTLAVDAINAEYLDRAPIQLPGQRRDHPCIFILKKTSPGCWKNKDRLPCVPEHQRFHVAPQFMTILFVIFAVHARGL